MSSSSTASPALRDRAEILAALTAALRQRVLVLDGAMGTMIQGLKLDEAGYRGERFKDWPRDVRGNNDLLNLSQPDAVRDIHLQYFLAGADGFIMAVISAFGRWLRIAKMLERKRYGADR